jgi:DNA invertase Pin-like site-specific DNA recombinase
VSSDKQDSSRQRENIEAWAARNGLVISHWYEDSKGKNPRDLADKRVDFQRLMNFAEAGAIDAIIVDSLDRFGVRDAYELGHYIHLLRNCGVELWSVTQGNLSASDAATILNSTVGAITSTNEQQEKAHRSLTGKRRRALKGLYVGGYPPYGLDVVCFGADGAEKWRLVWIAHYERLKIMPDGTEQRYSGKHNTPAHDSTDELRYRPSIRVERIEIVERIFKWYADEAISPSQIATRLNEMSVDPVFGEAWNKQKIKQLLKHPIYVGIPTVNKRGSARHLEFVDGEERPVSWEKGRPKAGRNRKAEDWWQPEEPEFPPIVSVETFDVVQERLKKNAEKYRNSKRRTPRTASFWLRNLLFCAKCNQPMRAWNCQGYRSYFCGTYGTYGKVNPTGCRSNRMKAEVVEKLVEEYLQETNQKIAELLKATESREWEATSPLKGELGQKYEELVTVYFRISLTVRNGDSNMPDEQPKPKDFDELVSIYKMILRQRKPELERQLAKLDEQHTALVDRMLSLSPRAKVANKKVNDRIVAVEVEMERTRGELEDASVQFDEIINEMTERKAAIQSARKAIRNDSAYRRKTELVSRVIDRIVCHFRDTDGRGNKPRSKLTKVAIFPVGGDSATFYPNGITPAKG